MNTRILIILAVLIAATVLASFLVAAGRQKLQQRPSAESLL